MGAIGHGLLNPTFRRKKAGRGKEAPESSREPARVDVGSESLSPRAEPATLTERDPCDKSRAIICIFTARATSSVERALVSGTKGPGFDPRVARQTLLLPRSLPLPTPQRKCPHPSKAAFSPSNSKGFKSLLFSGAGCTEENRRTQADGSSGISKKPPVRGVIGGKLLLEEGELP